MSRLLEFLSVFLVVLSLAWSSKGLPNNGLLDDDQRLDALKTMMLRRIRNSILFDGQSGSGNGFIPDNAWPGRWFPDKPVSHAQKPMWNMINSTCDDGKTNLTVDWSGSYDNYTCMTPKSRYEPDPDLPALVFKDSVPPEYKARHACMNEEITYPVPVTTYGTHRPAWPRYGEYKFVPRQRWIHSLEHGAVVMLYHPCAHPMLVYKLRRILTSCLYRHVITPYTLLSPERPLALFTWGWALLMSDVDTDIVRDFIKEHALNGPEKLSKDGQYDFMLVKPAKVVSDQEDSLICPDPR